MNTRLSKALADVGAVLKRDKKHHVYELPNGNKVTVAATPGDNRSELNAIADVKRAAGMVTESKVPTEFKNRKVERKPGRIDPAPALPVFTGSSALAVALSQSGVVEDSLRQEVARLRAELDRVGHTQQEGMEHMAIKAEVVNVTPEYARQILAEQARLDEHAAVKQRRIDKNRVGQYANEMRQGLWMLNGESIQFNGERLLNGQHRLAAVDQSGVTVPFLIVRGVDPSAFATIDQGKGRTIGDLLKMRGMLYTSEVAGAARVAWLYENCGRLRPTTGKRPTRHQVFEFVRRHEDALVDAARLAVEANIGHRSTLAGFAFLLRQQDDRQVFFAKLKAGVGLAQDEPVRHLRDRLMSFNAQRATTDGEIVFALCIKAWNATYRQQPISILRFGRSEEYPVLLR